MNEQLYFALSPDTVATLPKDARDNKRVTLAELHTILTLHPPPNAYTELPQLAANAFEQGNKAALDTLQKTKKTLPYFVSGGFCQVHHSNATLEYNGVVQIDYDIKQAGGDQQALEVLCKIKKENIPGLVLAGISPTTYGVKMLLATDNADKNRHSEALKFAIAYISEILEIKEGQGKFDTVGASQPVFLFYERTPGAIFCNENAGKLHIELKDTNAISTHPATTYSSEKVLAAAEYLIQNKVSVAGQYIEYVKIMLAIRRTFGAGGEGLALRLLDNSPEFQNSTTRSEFSKRYNARLNENTDGKKVTGATIVWHAQKAGFNPQYLGNERVFEGLDGEYLTETADRLNFDLNDFFGKYIVSPTGSGKTSLCAKLSSMEGRKVVLIVPTIAIIKKVASNHSDAVPFHGDVRILPDNARFVVTTVQSFTALATRVTLAEWDVFFDEAHALSLDTSTHYKLDEIRAFYRLSKGARSVSYLTGTPVPNYHPDFAQIETLRFYYPPKQKRSALIIECEEVIPEVVALFSENVADGRFQVILLNDKKAKLAKVKIALKCFKIAAINADEKGGDAYNEIVKNGKLPKGLEGLVVTGVLKEGVDINDEKDFDFIIIGKHHSATIEQVAARARKAKSVRAYIMKGKKKNADSAQKRLPDHAKAADLKRVAEKVCSVLNEQKSGLNSHLQDTEYNARQAIQSYPIHKAGDNYEVCYFALNNQVAEYVATTEHNDDRVQLAALAKFGFDVSGDNYVGTWRHFDKETEAEIKQKTAALRVDQAKTYMETLEALAKTVYPEMAIKKALNENKANSAHKDVHRLISDFNLSAKDVIALLIAGNKKGTEKGFKSLLNRVRIDYLRTHPDYMSKGTKFGKVLQCIDGAIIEGKRYSAAEVLNIVRSALSLDSAFDIERLLPESVEGNRKALEVMRMFCDVSNAKQFGRDQQRARAYSLKKTQIIEFKNHSGTRAFRTLEKDLKDYLRAA